MTAGAAGFLIFSHQSARPERYGRAQALRHDALAAERASLPVNDRAIRDEVRVEHDALMLAAQKRSQRGFDPILAVELASFPQLMKNGRVVVCEVRVFPLQVRRQNKQWPEKQERVVKWLSASQAADKVKDPILSDIIRRLARRYD